MIGYFKDFILNMFMIFAPMVFYPYIYKIKSKMVLYRFLIYILFSVALITTMSFPINLNGLIYDFRSIPLAIGSLYGGLQVSILLYATLVIYRACLGNPNELIYMVSLLPSFVVVIFSYKVFSTLKVHQKIILTVILCTVIKLITFTIYLSVLGQVELMYNEPFGILQTYLLQGLIVGICVYLIEFLNSHFHMQDEYIRSEKMKLVGDMAASVAHEIRNPLTTVRGFIHLFGTAPLNEEKKEFYKRICFEELDRAEQIITDYLSLAKPDPEVVVEMNINDEANYLSNVLLTYANYNDIQINVVAAEEKALCMTGDRYKFRQALINIGKNAIEAMESGGILELRTMFSNDQVWILISDSGSGMTAEQIKRLGTPYYSTKEKGTGLGTMVSFEIIKKMNGKIEIKSDVGKGTVFKLSFSRK